MISIVPDRSGKSSPNGRWYLGPSAATMPDMTVHRGKYVSTWPQAWLYIHNGPILAQRDLKMFLIAGLDLSQAGYHEARPMIDILAKLQDVAVGWQSMDGTLRVIALVESHLLYGSLSRTNPGVWAFTTPKADFWLAGTARSPVRDSADLVTNPPSRTDQGAFRGWRRWTIKDQGKSLGSPVYGNYSRWSKGWNEISPRTKGFFACDSVDRIMGQDSTQGLWEDGTAAVGSILGAGRVVKATRGFRSQYAKPEYLVLRGDFDLDADLLGLAEKYGMDLCTLDQARKMNNGLIPYQGELPEGYESPEER